jgi:hypothetical protein
VEKGADDQSRVNSFSTRVTAAEAAPNALRLGMPGGSPVAMKWPCNIRAGPAPHPANRFDGQTPGNGVN